MESALDVQKTLREILGRLDALERKLSEVEREATDAGKDAKRARKGR